MLGCVFAQKPSSLSRNPNWECYAGWTGGRWSYEYYTFTNFPPAQNKLWGLSRCRFVGYDITNYIGRNKHMKCPVMNYDGSWTTLELDGVACPNPGEGPSQVPWKGLRDFLDGYGSEVTDSQIGDSPFDDNKRFMPLYVRWQEKGRYVEPQATRQPLQLENFEYTDLQGLRHMIQWGTLYPDGSCMIGQEDSRDCGDAWQTWRWLCKKTKAIALVETPVK